eukprot:s2271_g14.t1
MTSADPHLPSGAGEARVSCIQTFAAKINLIDLAGSERTSKAQTEQERLKEGCAINQSLSQLGLDAHRASQFWGSQSSHVPSLKADLLAEGLSGRKLQDLYDGYNLPS